MISPEAVAGGLEIAYYRNIRPAGEMQIFLHPLRKLRVISHRVVPLRSFQASTDTVRRALESQESGETRSEEPLPVTADSSWAFGR